MRRTSHRLLLVVVVLAWTCGMVRAQPAVPFVETVERAMRTFDVPGVALSVVKDGRVVAARGFGVRTRPSSEIVDAHTLFGIASNTKVMTAVALGILVDEGRLEWDAPVVRYMPWFQMSDPFVTRELTVRDLLVHRSGLALGAGDLLWWPETTLSRREITERIRHVPLTTSFRSAYAYDNVLYIAAGELVEAVTGRPWEVFVSERVLAAVGMTTTRVRFPGTDAQNLAMPHAPIDGRMRPIRPFAGDNANPAAGVTSNATDMAAWMKVLLAEGRLADGSRLVTERTFRDIVTLTTPMRPSRAPQELPALAADVRGYALGLNVTEYRGRRVLTHTGGLPGYVSRVTLVPELGLGIAVLTNQESGDAFNAITNQIIDGYLGIDDVDWVAGYDALRARLNREQGQRDRATEERRATARAQHPLADYAGTYRDPWYGAVTISHEGERLVVRLASSPALVGDLEPWHYETFLVRWRDRELRADAFVTFTADPGGAITGATMRAVSDTTDFSFDFHDLRLVRSR